MNLKSLLFTLLLTITGSTYFVGCTSSSPVDEGAEVTDVGDMDDDVDDIDGADGEVADGEPDDAFETETIADDQDADFDSDTTADVGTSDSWSETSATPSMPTPEAPTSTPPSTSDSVAGVDTADDSYADQSSIGEPAEEPAPKPANIPYLKVETQAFNRAGQLLNAVYLARPGDSWKSVSQKIYGSDRVKDLKKVNTGFAFRELRAGDKVYYNSPQRPTDEGKILSYYEDMGVAPEVYVSQPKENIRTVAKKLLGFEDAWKEVWATNSVESKWGIPAGTQLRYWKAEAAKAPTLAQATTPPAMPSIPQPEPSAQQTDFPDMPPDTSGYQDVQPPPLPQQAEMMPPAEPMESFTPPPPMESFTPPPPPPPPVVAQEPMDETDAMAGMDDDTMMTLGAGAVIALALAVLIIVRRRRAAQAQAEMFTDTNAV